MARPPALRFGIALACRVLVILTVLRLKSVPPRIPDLLQALRALMRSARAEKGFVAGNLYLDAGGEDSILYEERWQTREALEEQVRSSRFTRLLAVMESASERPLLEFHFVAETRGLDYVAAVRRET